jgi:hypothetical protein
MSTEVGGDEPTWVGTITPHEATGPDDGLRPPDEAPAEGLTFDVELQFAPAEGFAPGEDEDETLAQVHRALEEILGPDFEKGLTEDEARMLDWLGDPERAFAFAIDPLNALERFDPPLDRELVDALRRAASMLEPPPRRARNVRVRLTGAGVQRG